ncbi:MAG: nucleotidyltransferase domain-containing protein [Candidatus Aenigmarchaeota archaeon]|nr:nucleotidyltransferase domain-containing protein [Candidatus Aenigmarchaeota archaeon]
MKTEIKIIKALLEGKEGHTIREIAKLTGADYRIVHEAVSRLLKKGLVDKRQVGKAVEITFSNKFSKEVFEAETEKAEGLLKDKNIKVLYEKLGALSFQLTALIFGSYAKGKAGKGSDIDLMVICGEEEEKQVESLVHTLPLNIHLTTLTTTDFVKMAKSKEFNVVNEAIKNSIILIGIENYYRLVGNAK